MRKNSQAESIVYRVSETGKAILLSPPAEISRGKQMIHGEQGESFVDDLMSKGYSMGFDAEYGNLQKEIAKEKNDPELVFIRTITNFNEYVEGKYISTKNHNDFFVQDMRQKQVSSLAEMPLQELFFPQEDEDNAKDKEHIPQLSKAITQDIKRLRSKTS